MGNSTTSANGDSGVPHSSTPNPIPPPPSATSRRSSSTSFARNTPDRILADVSLEGDTSSVPVYQASVLASPGATSNFSTETTTTIDIPDDQDITDIYDMSITTINSDVSPTANGLNMDPPMYTNMGSTNPMQPPPPIYYPGELPPAYQVAAALPTYEEAELTKAGKLDGSQIPIHVEIPGMITDANLTSDSEELGLGDIHHAGTTRGGRHSGRGRIGRQIPPGFTLLSFPSLDGDTIDSGESVVEASELLGNDFVFFTAFLTAFLFNWIGFLLLMCFCHTIAARYGALSGFGLSLAKWTLIVKNSTDLASADNSWLWWLITAFGMLVCMRAIFQYLHIKRTWGRLSTSARERLFFFY